MVSFLSYVPRGLEPLNVGISCPVYTPVVYLSRPSVNILSQATGGVANVLYCSTFLPLLALESLPPCKLTHLVSSVSITMVDRPRSHFFLLEHMSVHNELCPNIPSFPLAAGKFHHLLYRPGRVSLCTRICEFATLFYSLSLGVFGGLIPMGVVCLVSSIV